MMVILAKTFNVTTSTYGWTNQFLIADTNNESPLPYAALTEQFFGFSEQAVSIIYRPCANISQCEKRLEVTVTNPNTGSVFLRIADPSSDSDPTRGSIGYKNAVTEWFINTTGLQPLYGQPSNIVADFSLFDPVGAVHHGFKGAQRGGYLPCSGTYYWSLTSLELYNNSNTNTVQYLSYTNLTSGATVRYESPLQIDGWLDRQTSFNPLENYQYSKELAIVQYGVRQATLALYQQNITSGQMTLEQATALFVAQSNAANAAKGISPAAAQYAALKNSTYVPPTVTVGLQTIRSEDVASGAIKVSNSSGWVWAHLNIPEENLRIAMQTFKQNYGYPLFPEITTTTYFDYTFALSTIIKGEDSFTLNGPSVFSFEKASYIENMMYPKVFNIDYKPLKMNATCKHWVDKLGNPIVSVVFSQEKVANPGYVYGTQPTLTQLIPAYFHEGYMNCKVQFYGCNDNNNTTDELHFYPNSMNVCTSQTPVVYENVKLWYEEVMLASAF